MRVVGVLIDVHVGHLVARVRAEGAVAGAGADYGAGAEPGGDRLALAVWAPREGGAAGPAGEEAGTRPALPQGARRWGAHAARTVEVGPHSSLGAGEKC